MMLLNEQESDIEGLGLGLGATDSSAGKTTGSNTDTEVA